MREEVSSYNTNLLVLYDDTVIILSSLTYRIRFQITLLGYGVLHLFIRKKFIVNRFSNPKISPALFLLDINEIQVPVEKESSPVQGNASNLIFLSKKAFPKLLYFFKTKYAVYYLDETIPIFQILDNLLIVLSGFMLVRKVIGENFPLLFFNFFPVFSP